MIRFSGSMYYLSTIAFRNIFRNTRRSILCVLAVSIAVLLIVFFMAYIEGMMDSLKIIATTFETGHIKITTNEFIKKETFLPLQYPIENKEELYRKLYNIKGVVHITDRILTYATFTNSKVKHGLICGINIDDIINSEKENVKYGFYNFTEKNNGILVGRYPEKGRNECAIGYRLAKKMEIVPIVLEKNEYNWIKENLKEENQDLFKYYIWDDKINAYKLNLFKYEGMNKNELKKKLKVDKENYLKLINVFINLEIKNLPEKIEKDSITVENLLTVDFVKDLFLQYYNEKNKIFYKKSNLNNEELLGYFQEAVTIRVPFKIVSSEYSDKYFSPKLVGIFEYDYINFDESLVIMPIERIEKATSMLGKAQNVYIYIEKKEEAPKIRREIEKIIKNERNENILVVKDWLQSSFIAMFNQFEILYYMIYAVFLIIASFLIINTVLMVIHERIKEIGMMGALGMKRFEIVIVFFLEALFLSLFGSLLGVILGGVSTFILSFMPINIEALTGGVDFPTTNTMYVKFSFIILLVSFLFGVVVSSACTIIPSLKSAFIEPVEALRR